MASNNPIILSVVVPRVLKHTIEMINATNPDIVQSTAIAKTSQLAAVPVVSFSLLLGNADIILYIHNTKKSKKQM